MADVNEDSRIFIDQLDHYTLSKFKANPSLFVEMCGWHTWKIQREIIESVRDNKYTAVVSCPDSGKTWVAARVALWYLNLYVPSIVIAIAPLLRQIKDLFWKEFREAHGSSNIGLLGTPKKDSHMEISPDHFIRGVIASDDSQRGSVQDKMTGYHSPNILVIMDQADGLSTDVWEAVWGLMTSGHVRLLTLTNPLGPDSENGIIRAPEMKTRFGEKFFTPEGLIKPKDGHGWNIIKIRAQDTPNIVEGTDIIPGLMSVSYYDEMCRNLSPDDPYFRMMMMAEDVDMTTLTFLTRTMVKEAFKLDIPADFHNIRIGLDVADEGADRSVWTVMGGNRLLFIDSVRGHNTAEVTDHCKYIKEKVERLTGREPDEWIIDAIGIGKGVFDQMVIEGYPVMPIYAGESVDDRYQRKNFANKRAELCWHLRELCEANALSLLPLFPAATDERELELLREECLKVRYVPDAEKIVALKKKLLRKFLKRSPDNWDSLAMACCPYGNAPLIEIIDIDNYVENKPEPAVIGEIAVQEPEGYDINNPAAGLTDDEVEERFF